jgi:hypothetical protein
MIAMMPLLLLVLMLLLLPPAAIGERASKEDATITKTKDGGNCLMKFSAIFFLASSIVIFLSLF